MLHYIFVCFLSLLTFTSLALPPTHAAQPPAGFLLNQQKIIAEAATISTNKFPNADCVLVNNCILETYEADGTSISWDDEYVMVLTEKGRRESVSHQLTFNTHYGTSFVYRAEIITSEGLIVPIDVAATSRLMTEPGQMNQNIYDPNDKTLSFSIPGLKLGDICHLTTCRITSKARMPGTWSDFTVFETTSPIINLSYMISAPPDKPIRKSILRAPVTNTVTHTKTQQLDGHTLHMWQVKNMPQMFLEPNMPPWHTEAQRLIISTIADWATVSRWYWNLCLPALGKTTPAMQKTVDTLIANATSREEKIQRIFTFVSQTIRYMGITPEETAPGYEPHAVSLTFHNRYGICRDKAALLTAMLKLAGIPAYPVLIHAGAKIDPEVPVPFFNHAITAVDNPLGGYTLMDPTDENTRDLLPAYLCNRSYLVARPEGETLLVSAVYPAEKNLSRITSEGTLDTTGSLLLKTHIRFDGINDNAYRGYLLRQKTDQRRMFFESILKSRMPGAELIECVISPNNLQDTSITLTATLTTRIPNFPVRGERLDLINIPWLGSAFGYANGVIGQTGLQTRRYTLETGITCGIKETVSINIAAGLGTPHAVPTETHIDYKGIHFEMTQAVTNGLLTGSLSYLLTTPEFSPAEYLDLKKALIKIETASRHRPLFLASDPSLPNLAILKDETDTVILTPQTWITTHCLTQRVLTYAGKKQASELKIPYNPAWQTMTLLSATISNVNGTVYSISPKEINVMDTSWVGSAPRYPAAKTLVINLPGVEIGSVINFTTRATQDQAYFYSHVQTFGGYEPVQKEVFRLTYPKTLTPSLRLFHSQHITTTVATNTTSITHTWQATASTALRSEDHLPPWHFFRPTLFVSFGEWQAHAHQLQRAIAKTSKNNTLARHRAKELVKGLKTPNVQIRAIRDEVLRTIRPAGPSFLSLPPNTLSAPDRTLTDQYGHPADRAILLASMLDAVGFDAEIVFASNDTTQFPDVSRPYHEIPQLEFYCHPLVAVKHPGGTYYLNEGDQYDELGSSALHAAPALSLKGKFFAIALSDTLRNRQKNAWHIVLDENGDARITVSEWFFGKQAGLFRKLYREMLPENRRRHQLELANAITKSAEVTSDLITDTLAYPAFRTHTITARNYAIIENNTLTLLIPEVTGTLFPVRTDTRENPMFLKGLDPDELSCRITLPRGYTRLAVAPVDTQWTLPNGLGTLDYKVETSTLRDGRMEVCLTRHIKRESGEAPPELYPALLEYNRRLSHPTIRTLVVERVTSH